MMRRLATRRLFCALLLTLAAAAEGPGGTPVLDVWPHEFRVARRPGVAALPRQFDIRNVGDAPLDFSVSVDPGRPWLSVTPSSGSLPPGGVVRGKLKVDSNALAGSYQGSFTITAPGAADAPRTVPVAFDVTSNVIPAQDRVELFLKPGETGTTLIWFPLVDKSFASIPNMQVRTDDGGGWLTLKLRRDNAMTIETRVAPLGEGVWKGNLDFGTAEQPSGTIPVTVTVSSKPALSFRPAELRLQMAAGQSGPAASAQVSTNGGAADWSVTASAANGGNWLRAQRSGSAAVATVDGSSLAPGIYRGSLQILSDTAANPATTVPVELRVLAPGPPVISLDGVVDAASYCAYSSRCYLAPGQLASVFGSQLAYTTAHAAALPLPAQLGTTRLLVNGAPAELVHAEFGQINFRVPELPAGATRLFVQAERDGQKSNLVSVPCTSGAPGIFTVDSSGAGYGAILHANTARLVSAADPAVPGEYLEIYVTGLGGTLFGNAVEKPTVVLFGPGITGTIELQPSYAGLAPGFPGLYQVNVRIPAGAPRGDHMRLELRTPFNLTSNMVDLAIR